MLHTRSQGVGKKLQSNINRRTNSKKDWEEKPEEDIDPHQDQISSLEPGTWNLEPQTSCHLPNK